MRGPEGYGKRLTLDYIYIHGCTHAAIPAVVDLHLRRPASRAIGSVGIYTTPMLTGRSLHMTCSDRIASSFGSRTSYVANLPAVRDGGDERVKHLGHFGEPVSPLL